MRLTGHLRNFGACSLLLCGTMFAQSSLSTYVQGSGSGVNVCSDSGQGKANCTGSDLIVDGSVDVGFSDSGSTDAGFGPMKAEGHSEITVAGGGSTTQAFYNDFITTATSEDELSIIGLADGQIAYLSGFFATIGVFRPSVATYSIYIGSSQYSECVVNSSALPNCRLKLPITYEGGAPVNFSLIRELITNADSNLASGAPAGAVVNTGILVSAYANFAVVDAEGHTISGVTVVGSSGHIYN